MSDEPYRSMYIECGESRRKLAMECDRLAAELAEAKAHAEALRQRTCPCYLYTDPDCPYLSSAGPPQVPDPYAETIKHNLANQAGVDLNDAPAPGRRCTCENFPGEPQDEMYPACPVHGT